MLQIAIQVSGCDKETYLYHQYLINKYQSVNFDPLPNIPEFVYVDMLIPKPSKVLLMQTSGQHLTS